MKEKLLFRIAPHNGGAVFALEKRAIYVAAVHSAIKNSKTWGDFRSAMPIKDYSEIVRVAFDDVGERRPKNSDEFSSDSVPGYSDGDYPPWLQTELETILPRSLLEKFGHLERTNLNGNFWLIPEKNLEALCDELRRLGYELGHAQQLPFH